MPANEEEPLDSDDEQPVEEAQSVKEAGPGGENDDESLYPAARSLKEKGDNSYHYWHGHAKEAPPPVPVLLKTGETDAPEPLADGLKLKSGTVARCRPAARADSPPRLLSLHLAAPRWFTVVADAHAPPDAHCSACRGCDDFSRSSLQTHQGL
jgi:hypothetical protein